MPYNKVGNIGIHAWISLFRHWLISMVSTSNTKCTYTLVIRAGHSRWWVGSFSLFILSEQWDGQPSLPSLPGSPAAAVINSSWGRAEFWVWRFQSSRWHYLSSLFGWLLRTNHNKWQSCGQTIRSLRREIDYFFTISACDSTIVGFSEKFSEGKSYGY